MSVTVEMPSMPVPAWKSTGEVAAIYGKDRDTVWKWIAAGLDSPYGRLKLHARKLGGEWGIKIEDVETYFDALGGDEKALAVVLQWKCNRDLRTPVSETPAAVNTRARRDQDRARKALGGK